MKLEDFNSYEISNNDDGTIEINGDIDVYNEKEDSIQRFSINIPRAKILEVGDIIMLDKHQI